MLLLKVIVVVLVVVELSSSTIATIAAPTEEYLKNHGYANRCGNLNILYPFGVKENCYHNDNFFFNCSDSQPYLQDILICLFQIYHLRRVSIDYVPNGTCSGIGCCQTSIPKGVRQIHISADSFYKHKNVLDFNPYGYAFVVEDGAFNFPTTYLQDFKPEELPMVLDWGIGDNELCDGAKTNTTSFACGNNIACYDFEDVGGYFCKCLSGYKGNLYLFDGCRDIDVCADPKLNQCVDGSKCLNKPPGSYTCSCPKGYHGDGKKDGTRCINQFLTIQIVVGSATGVALVLLCSSWLYWILRKRKYIKRKRKVLFAKWWIDIATTTLQTREISSRKLKEAVEKGKIVGQGGNGIVYKGTLADGRVVAIKECKFKEVDQSQIEQFINEIVVISQINHQNVVKLLGCCLETQIPSLVYEFMTNGTLHDHIHEEPAISWQIRLRIATETSGVLSYLHSEASIPIIHRDVKPTNILLDHNYTTKVSDFGASRLVPLDQNPLGTVLEGTPGYLDPESLHTGQLTEKSDVYSFGVVLAELITGKKVLSYERPKEERCLATYFLSSLRNDRLYQVIDEHIVIEGDNFEQLKEVAGIAERCLKVKGDERPTMKEVATELEGLIAKKMENKHPWVKTKSDVSSEETEDLLGENSNGYALEILAITLQQLSFIA
ncbi:hypothetical protein ACSBR1_001206 [Camellia fascicularis]